jgi:hypothetical protein
MKYFNTCFTAFEVTAREDERTLPAKNSMNRSSSLGASRGYLGLYSDFEYHPLNVLPFIFLWHLKELIHGIRVVR